jgi:hypothetical protein
MVVRPQEGIKIPKQTFWRTILILFIGGSSLDYFFANRFFTYNNHAATLRIPAPALGGSVPMEEYVFYLTGFIAVLLIYVWLDEYWLLAYKGRIIRRKQKSSGGSCSFIRHLWCWDWP